VPAPKPGAAAAARAPERGRGGPAARAELAGPPQPDSLAGQRRTREDSVDRNQR